MTYPILYEPAQYDSGGPMPGARLLMASILQLYPGSTNLGIYNNRAQRGTKVTSVHAEGRALDVGFPDIGLSGNPVGNRLAADLVRLHAPLGIQCVIWCRRIWSTRHPTWHAYTGVDPHTGHLHIELNRAAAKALTSAEAVAALRPPVSTPQPPQENPMAVPQPTLGDVQLFVAGCYSAAGNDDPKGEHYWTWQIAMADDWTVPARELRRQLGLK